MWPWLAWPARRRNAASLAWANHVFAIASSSLWPTITTLNTFPFSVRLVWCGECFWLIANGSVSTIPNGLAQWQRLFFYWNSLNDAVWNRWWPSEKSPRSRKPSEKKRNRINGMFPLWSWNENQWHSRSCPTIFPLLSASVPLFPFIFISLNIFFFSCCNGDGRSISIIFWWSDRTSPCAVGILFSLSCWKWRQRRWLPVDCQRQCSFLY